MTIERPPISPSSIERNILREFNLQAGMPFTLLLQEGDEIRLQTKKGTYIGTLKCSSHEGEVKITVENDRNINGIPNTTEILDGHTLKVGRKLWPMPLEEIYDSKEDKTYDEQEEEEREEDDEPESLDFSMPIPRLQERAWKPGERKERAPAIKDNHVKISVKKDAQGYQVTFEDLNSKNGAMGIFTRGENITELNEYKDKLLSLRDGEISAENGKYAGLTETGSKSEQQDAVLISNSCIALADGHDDNGGLAARIALQTIDKGLKKSSTSLKDLLLQSSDQLKKRKIVGTTITCARVVMKGDKRILEVGNRGDSRTYVVSLSKKRLLYMTKDDSVVQEEIDKGNASESERLTHWRANVITKRLPFNDNETDTVIKEIPLVDALPGDTLVIQCSDGIVLYPEEILDYALKYRQLCCPEIMNLARSRHDQPNGFKIKIDGKQHHIKKNVRDNRSIAMMLI